MDQNQKISKIEATLTGIRFQNEQNFIIGIFHNTKGEFGGLGTMFRPEIGMKYYLFGEWSTHPQYGTQVKFIRYETIQPKDTNGIYQYLVRIAKWVGPSTGDKLVEAYGESTLEILRTEPDRVAREIAGITEPRAIEIQESLIELQDIESQLVDLSKMLSVPGLRRSLPFDLIDRFGSNAVEALHDNPYILTDFPGVGFKLADQVATSIKFDHTSIFRKMAGVCHALKENEHEGNTWHTGTQLIEDANSLLGISTSREAITRLIEEDKVSILDQLVALKSTDSDENYIAGQICKLLT